MKTYTNITYSEFEKLCDKAKSDGWYYTRSWSMGVGVIYNKASYDKEVDKTINKTDKDTVAKAIVCYNPDDSRIDNTKRIHAATGRLSLSLSKMLVYYFEKLRQ